jgi:ATP-dependent DNA helicase RecQ
MMGRDLVRPDADRHGALRMTEAARPILRGEAGITLRRDTVQSAAARPAVTALISDENEPLLSALKAKRRALAEAASVPAYIIFPDRTLIEMAERRPVTLDQMAAISGVGAKKLESFGAAFLKVITGSAPVPLHPQRMKLAGRDAGALFDRLCDIQLRLQRGEDGTEKPLSCTFTTLRKIAEARPASAAELEAIQGLGPLKSARFGAAFLAAITMSDGSQGCGPLSGAELLVKLSHHNQVHQLQRLLDVQPPIYTIGSNHHLRLPLHHTLRHTPIRKKKASCFFHNLVTSTLVSARESTKC